MTSPTVNNDTDLSRYTANWNYPTARQGGGIGRIARAPGGVRLAGNAVRPLLVTDPGLA